MNRPLIYADNAASSWPKPPEVMEATAAFLRERAANPGRSGHRLAIEAGREVYHAREAVARLLGLADPLAVVFTRNATEALNLAIFGLVKPGDHVVTCRMEHNSILRPLSELERRGVSVTRLPPGPGFVVEPQAVAEAIGGRTRLVVLGHAANVTGAIAPIAEIGEIVGRTGTLLAVDGAQSAGVESVDIGSMGIDLFAFTGHKGLLGPQGTGGLCLGPRAADRVRPLVFGGTGSDSHSDVHPEFLPDRLEAGTPNGVGLAGLAAGIGWIEAHGREAIRRQEIELTGRLIEGLRRLSGVRLYGPGDPERQTAVVPFNVDGFACSDVALRLEEEAGICCRAGLHCAPLAHRELGTFPDGVVRFSLGPFTTGTEVDAMIDSVAGLGRPKRWE